MQPRLCRSCGRPVCYKDGTPIVDQEYCCGICEWYENLPEDKKQEIKKIADWFDKGPNVK